MQHARAPYQIVPVVFPVSNDPNTSGKIRCLPCGGGVQHPQIEAILDDEGTKVLGYEVRARARRQGYVLLQELFEAEDRHEDWRLFLRVMEAASAGRTKATFPRDRLPAEVLRRQQAALPDEFADLLAAKPMAVVVEQPPDEKPRDGSQPDHAPGRKVKAGGEVRA